MRHIVFLFLFLPAFLWGQYPNNPRKQRLGYQTTGAGLTYIKDGTPTHTPADDEDTWMVLDTTNNILYYWDETAGAWENLLNDITRDTVFQITNVSDTTTLAPVQGDAFIDSTADTLGLYAGPATGWVLFYGGSVEQADGVTILGNGSGGDPFRVDSTLMATRAYADNAATAVSDSLGSVKMSVFLPPATTIPGCESSIAVVIGGYIEDPSISVGDNISGDITYSGTPTLAVTYIQEEDGFAYFETSGFVSSAGSYAPTWEYKGIELAPVFEVYKERPDTVTVWETDTTTVTRVCGTVIQRDTISAGGGGSADGVATAGAHDTVNEEIDITVASPGSNFSIDISALASDSELAAKPGGSGTTNRTALWTAASTLGNSYFLQSASGVTMDAGKWLRTSGIGVNRDPFGGRAFDALGGGIRHISSVGSHTFEVNGSSGAVSIATTGGTVGLTIGDSSYPKFTVGTHAFEENMANNTFFIRDLTAGINYFRLTSAGNVSVGNGDPTYKFEIMGTSAAFRIAPRSTTPTLANGLIWADDNYDWLKASDGTNSFFLAKTSVNGSTFTQGNIPFADANGALGESADLTWDNANSELETTDIIVSEGIAIGGSDAAESDSYLIAGSDNGTKRIKLHRYGNSIEANELITGKARGTYASPSNALTGDYLGGLEFHQFQNGFFRRSSFILPVVQDTTTANYHSALWFSVNFRNLADPYVFILEDDNAQFQGTGALALFDGTTAERPGIPVQGQIRANTDNDTFEGYDGTKWKALDNKAYTPTSTADTYGSEGDITYDDDYIYIKTSAGWKRSALSTF